MKIFIVKSFIALECFNIKSIAHMAVFLGLSLFSAATFAQLELSYLFNNHMVLQRNMPIPIWGKALPDDEIKIVFSGQIKTTQADDRGLWTVNLDPMKASTVGQKLIITSDQQQIIVQDVLIGDVWLCSGQSNMEFSIAGLINNNLTRKTMSIVEQIKHDVKITHDPLIRLIKTKRNVSAFTPLEQSKGQWAKATTTNILEFSAVAFYFARALRESIDVPIGLVLNAYGGTPIESWLPVNYWQKNTKLTAYYKKQITHHKVQLASWNEQKAVKINQDIISTWEKNSEQAKLMHNPAPKKPKLLKHPNTNRRIPSSMYNAMHSPVVPYAIKGAIWYQGEANANSGQFAETYATQFKELVTTWRREWQQPELPIYSVQLANFGKNPVSEKLNNTWSHVRNQQRLAMSIPHTGMAVTIDIGQADDIHPKNKIDVGKRLALWALSKTYNLSVGEYSGPLIKSAVQKNDQIILSFDHAGLGLISNTTANPKSANKLLAGFELQNQNNQWQFTQATITGNNTVSIVVKATGKIKAVRYAWASNPETISLYNNEGLPASPFQIVLPN